MTLVHHSYIIWLLIQYFFLYSVGGCLQFLWSCWSYYLLYSFFSVQVHIIGTDFVHIWCVLWCEECFDQKKCIIAMQFDILTAFAAGSWKKLLRWSDFIMKNSPVFVILTSKWIYKEKISKKTLEESQDVW